MSLADKGVDLADEHMDAWVEKALEKARSILDDNAPMRGPGPTTLAHEAAVAALDALDAHRDDLAVLGRWSAASALAAFGAGQADAEALAWVRAGATFEERLTFQRGSTEQLDEARRAREAAWASLRATLEDVGRAAIRYLVPFLVAALAAV